LELSSGSARDRDHVRDHGGPILNVEGLNERVGYVQGQIKRALRNEDYTLVAPVVLVLRARMNIGQSENRGYHAAVTVFR
jgi:hypothetical protein